jgi:hypothetical protein
MPITLNGDTGITTPSYGGADTSEYLVPVTAFKNRIINGAMQIDQRNAGASVTVNNPNNNYAVDRTLCTATSSAGVFTSQQSSVAPNGFTNSLLCTVTTSSNPVTTNEYNIRQAIEGFNVADLGWGTANAQTVTLSFWVRSSLTGTFAGSFTNSAYDRSYVFTYTINSANTWEQKTVTIAGDTTGTWLTNSSAGIRLTFNLGAGATRVGTAGAWGAGYLQSATGSVNLIQTTGATFYITGVQLEKGSTATSFDYRPYGTELALCQRYYQTSTDIQGIGNTTTSIFANIGMQVPLRASPTIGLTGVYSITDVFAANPVQLSATLGTFLGVSSSSLLVELTSFSGLTTGRLYISRFLNANVITLSAEL